MRSPNCICTDRNSSVCDKCLKQCPSSTSVLYTDLQTTGPSTSNSDDSRHCSGCQNEYPLCTTTITTDASQESRAETYTNSVQDCSSGTIAGSAIIGALFGSFVTVLIVILHRHIQKKQKRNQVPKALQNPLYQAEMMYITERAEGEDTGKSMYSEIKDQNSMKVSHVAPILRNENTAKTNDGVYNTLNETNTVDRSEYYNHARPGASVSTPSNGYGTLNMEYDHVGPGASVSTTRDGYGTVKLECSENNKHLEDDQTLVSNEEICGKNHIR